MQGDDRPDNVASKVYGDASLDWVVLTTNNVIHVRDEWPMGSQDFLTYLNEKYTSLASDASSSDDRILAESFLQFADHYYRLQKEFELNNENKESKLKTELNSESNNSTDIELEDHEKISKKPSRRKRGFQMREAELSSVEDKTEANEINDTKNDKREGDNLQI